MRKKNPPKEVVYYEEVEGITLYYDKEGEEIICLDEEEEKKLREKTIMKPKSDLKRKEKKEKKKGVLSRLVDMSLYVLLIGSMGVSMYAIKGFMGNVSDREETDKSTELTQEIGNPTVVEEEEMPPYLKVDIEGLKEKNEEVVGWLKVGSVGIDLPIVQGEDNDFYLNHDIEKKKNSGGWVFVDARADIESSQLNTVIYGHNLIGRQFGLLKKILKEEVNSKEGSDIIQLTTEYEERVYEIVSVYITEYDDWGYAQQGFGSEESKKKYIENMKVRNKVKAYDREDLSINDEYITFSTCHGTTGTTKRLVVHARQIASRTRFEEIIKGEKEK